MSMILTVKVEAAEIVAAVRDLIAALSAGRTLTAPAPAPALPAAAPAPVPAPVPAAPAPAPAAAAPVAPPAAVPTSGAPTYTFEQLAVAATPIIDAGRRQELVNLLGAFGVTALTQLPKEQYGAFATKLRELGAKI